MFESLATMPTNIHLVTPIRFQSSFKAFGAFHLDTGVPVYSSFVRMSIIGS